MSKAELEYELMEKQAGEGAAYHKEKQVSYEKLRRTIIKSLWKLCKSERRIEIENLDAILEEVRQWEVEWGIRGRKFAVLKKRFDKEIDKHVTYCILIDKLLASVDINSN